MKMFKNQSGFAITEVALVVVIVAVLAFVGYKVMNNKNNPSTVTTNASTAAAATLPSKIKSKADVSRSIKALDDTPIDSKLDPKQLDTSINSLL